MYFSWCRVEGCDGPASGYRRGGAGGGPGVHREVLQGEVLPVLSITVF